MTSLEWIAGFTVSLITMLGGLLFKTQKTRIDDLDRRLRHAIHEEDVRSLLKDKLEPLKVQYVDFHRRLERLETKIDTLLELSCRTKK